MKVQLTNNQQSFGINESTAKSLIKTVDITVAGVKSAYDAFICAHTGAPYPTVDALTTTFDTPDVLIGLKTLVKRLFPKEPAIAIKDGEWVVHRF